MKIFLFLLCGLILSFPAISQEDIFSAENSMRYARYLYKTGQYNEASKELERVVFMNPTDHSAKFLLLESLKQSRAFSKGISKAEEFFTEIGSAPPNLSVSYAQMLILNREEKKLQDFLKTSITLPDKDRIFILLNYELFQKNWGGAKTIWEENKLSSDFPLYQSVIADASSVKYKSPVLSAALSMIVPGAGKFYTRDWVDGLLSMLTVGTLSFQAYRGFSAKGSQSAYGWVFGTLALGFYSGNVYGSFKAAKAYNTQIDQNILKNAEALFINSY